MAASRNPFGSLLTLVVYLAGLVGGGLHHHVEPGRRAPTEAVVQQAGQPDSHAATCGDDAATCAVCAAIHQAKAASPTVSVVASAALTADSVSPSTAEPPLPFRAATRARAPPAL